MTLGFWWELLKEHDLMAERWNYFPNSNVAQYEQLSQVIVLNEVSSGQYEDAVRSKDILQLQRVAPVLWHELRHYIDHCATVWGQRDLTGAYEALAARAYGTETDYWKVMEYYRNSTRDRYERFYTTTENELPVQGKREWTAALSTGVRFDHFGHPDESKPILFTRFTWTDGSPACRVPLSVASLLEVSAMHFEWHMRTRLAMRLDESVAAVEMHVVRQELMEYLFSPQLAQYSVAVHLLANKHHVTDGLLAFEASAALAWLALNLTDGWFEQLLIPAGLDAWGSRNQAFLQEKDRGYAYYLLTQASVPIDRSTSIEDWMDATVRAAGLPSLKEVQETAHAERAANRERGIGGSLATPFREELAHLMMMGEIIATRCIPFPTLDNANVALSETGMPFIQFNDLAVLQGRSLKAYGEADTRFDWQSERNLLIGLLSQFIDACGK